jgi:hypothetical protein
MIEALELRAREYFEGDPVPTHLDYITCYMEDGHTLNELAAEMSTALGFEVYRGWFGSYLRDTFGQAAEERLTNARVSASHTMAEQSIGIADVTCTTAVEVAQAGNKMRSRQWVAERWNASQYGRQQAPIVSISLHGLHLDALRSPQAIVIVAPQSQLMSGNSDEGSSE